MEEMEEKILGVLNDPEKMAQVMEMAKSLGFSPEDAPAQAADASAPVLELLRNAGTSDHRQAALMDALVPYLKPQRREKLQRALRLAKLSHLAGYALQNDWIAGEK